MLKRERDKAATGQHPGVGYQGDQQPQDRRVEQRYSGSKAGPLSSLSCVSCCYVLSLEEERSLIKEERSHLKTPCGAP